MNDVHVLNHRSAPPKRYQVLWLRGLQLLLFLVIKYSTNYCDHSLVWWQEMLTFSNKGTFINISWCINECLRVSDKKGGSSRWKDGGLSHWCGQFVLTIIEEPTFLWIQLVCSVTEEGLTWSQQRKFLWLTFLADMDAQWIVNISTVVSTDTNQ